MGRWIRHKREMHISRATCMQHYCKCAFIVHYCQMCAFFPRWIWHRNKIHISRARWIRHRCKMHKSCPDEYSTMVKYTFLVQMNTAPRQNARFWPRWIRHRGKMHISIPDEYGTEMITNRRCYLGPSGKWAMWGFAWRRFAPTLTYQTPVLSVAAGLATSAVVQLPPQRLPSQRLSSCHLSGWPVLSVATSAVVQCGGDDADPLRRAKRIRVGLRQLDISSPQPRERSAEGASPASTEKRRRRKPEEFGSQGSGGGRERSDTRRRSGRPKRTSSTSSRGIRSFQLSGCSSRCSYSRRPARPLVSMRTSSIVVASVPSLRSTLSGRVGNTRKSGCRIIQFSVLMSSRPFSVVQPSATWHCSSSAPAARWICSWRPNFLTW